MTIRREIFKTNSELTIAQYQQAYGNAGTALQAGRSGELVVDLADPTTPLLYIANNIGNLSLIGPGGSGGNVSNLVNGNSNVIVSANSNVSISVAGIANGLVVSSNGTAAVTYIGSINIGTNALVADTNKVDINGVTATFDNAGQTGLATSTGTNAIFGGNVVVTDVIKAGNGSISAPTYGFSADGSTDTGFYWVSDGNIGVTNNGVQSAIFRPNSIKQTAVTFSALPAAGTAGAGSRAFITDGNLAASTNFGAQVAGSGSNNVPVYSDGTNWRIG